MTDRKLVMLNQTPGRRERLKEVAEALVTDLSDVQVKLRRNLAPVVGQEMLDTLERLETAARYWYLGEEGSRLSSRLGGTTVERYRRTMYAVLQQVKTRLEENLASEGLTDKDLTELAWSLEFGAEQIQNYMASIDIERQIKRESGLEG